MANPRPAPTPTLFADAAARQHPRLFLPRLLAAESRSAILDTPQRDAARKVLARWADLADAGKLDQKETALDAEFLDAVFGTALGYRTKTDSPDAFERQRQFAVKGAGFADAALGRFAHDRPDAPPVAVVELKGAATDLDHDKSNGRTAVQQCWDYLAQLPATPWGVVSNYVTIRLYHRDRPARQYEEFTLNDLRDPRRFDEFYFLLQRDGLLGNRAQPPRAADLTPEAAMAALQQPGGTVIRCSTATGGNSWLDTSVGPSRTLWSSSPASA